MLFAVVPIVLYLTTSTKYSWDYLVLHKSEVTILSLYTQNFVEESVWKELIPNLSFYVIVMAVSFCILYTINQTRILPRVLIYNLVIIPWIISLITLELTNQSSDYGFSGIDAAFAGLLFITLALWIGSSLGLSIGYTVVSVLIFLLCYVVAEYTILPLEGKLSVFALLIGFLVILSFFQLRAPSIGVANSLSIKKRCAGTIMYSAVIFLVVLVIGIALFPSNIVEELGVVNILAHYFGFACGLIGVSLIVLTIPTRLGRIKRRQLERLASGSLSNDVDVLVTCFPDDWQVTADEATASLDQLRISGYVKPASAYPPSLTKAGRLYARLMKFTRIIKIGVLVGIFAAVATTASFIVSPWEAIVISGTLGVLGYLITVND